MGGFLLDLLDFVVLVLFLIGVARKIGSLLSSSRVQVRTSSNRPPSPSAAAPHRGEMVRDPVCGMFVATELSQKLKRGGSTVHFCSLECMDKYRKDAEHAAS
jgi:YHS domain-containing protein